MIEYGEILVRIKGVTPLLMNRISVNSLLKRSNRIRDKLEEEDFEKQARESAYIDEIDGKKQLYIPAEAVYRCLLNGAKGKREKSTKISLVRLLAGSVRIEPEKIPLGTDKYEIDIRPVVIQKSRVLKARAKVPKWEAEFKIIYNKRLQPIIDKIKECLEEAGVTYGLLDYRPERGGNFGVFEVIKFEILK